MARPPFAKLLVANRGEIAVRVVRACRALGVRSVAIHSEADAGALHARLADEAHPCGPPEPARSYLDVERIVGIARATGCQALHPGYGFLSESGELADACAAAGIRFVGPAGDVIRRMGDKVRARAAMQEAGVPVVPGALRHLDDAELAAAARELGFPVMVKASAGGGGRGLRVVHDAEGLAQAVESARAEARASFGDGALYLEKRLEGARHVEVQVLADRAGRVVHLFERECSVQRRHQKLFEEAPAPGLRAETRAALGAAACAAARAVGYEGAGTVEFLLTPDARFHFLEMNTRIQVEHPVTEAVTGVDLVAAQLRIAAGEPLPFAQADLAVRGHAVEARIYAEDPARRFLPQPGHVRVFDAPSGPGIRVDAGVAAGSAVPVHYDALLAKLVAHGADRTEALARLDAALRELRIGGVATTTPFHRWLLARPELRAGPLHTGFVDACVAAGPVVPEDADARRRALLAAACVAFEGAARARARVAKQRLAVEIGAPDPEAEGAREVALDGARQRVRCTEIAPHRWLLSESAGRAELVVTPARRGLDVLVEGQHFAIVFEPAA